MGLGIDEGQYDGFSGNRDGLSEGRFDGIFVGERLGVLEEGVVDGLAVGLRDLFSCASDKDAQNTNIRVNRKRMLNDRALSMQIRLQKAIVAD